MATYGYDYRFRMPRSRRSDVIRDDWPDPDVEYRMGIRDFAEGYGRYSGGDPYDYEVSERTIAHPHPPAPRGWGFSRRLDGGSDSWARDRRRRRGPRGGRRRWR